MKVPTFRNLGIETWRSWRRYGAKLAAVTALVAVPVNLLGLSAQLAADASLSAYVSLLSLIAGLALLWSTMRLESGQTVTLRQAYYEGTAALVKFMLVAVILTLELVPLLIGTLVYSAGMVAGAAALGEQLLLGAILLLLAAPSVYWINRSLFSLFLVVDSPLTPMSAIKASNARVKGRSWRVLANLLKLLAALILILALPIAGLMFVTRGDTTSWLWVLPQLAIALILLPMTNIYLYKLFLNLKAGK